MKILELVENCKTIGISGHVNPDGDCAGSCMGMALFLRKYLPGARVDVFLEELPPELERNIPCTDTIDHTFTTDVESYDAFILLDVDNHRAGPAGSMFDKAAKRINIDHHISNKGCGEYNYIDSKASSACELVYNSFDGMPIDKEIAQALYVGIVTDTGTFRFSNTGKHTLKIAGELITHGFDFSKIVREVYFERSPKQMRVFGEAFRLAQIKEDGKLVISVMSHDEIIKIGATNQDMDGAAEQLVLTEGADCAVFAHEDEPGLWRLSMRSLQIVDVARVAGKFGGGGHIRAAGCTIHTRNFQPILARIVKLVHEQLAGKDL